MQCDLRGVEDRQFPFALHYFTGSKAHNIAIRKRALARGLSLNEYALPARAGDGRLPDRGRAVRGARTGRDSARTARGHGRDRGRRERHASRPGQRSRPDRHVSLPYRLERRRAPPLNRWPKAPASAGLNYLGIADHSRSPRHAGGSDDRAGPRPVGRDRCIEREIRQAGSGSSRGPSATSWPTARSIIPTSCSTASTTWSPAFTPTSACRARR